VLLAPLASRLPATSLEPSVPLEEALVLSLSLLLLPGFLCVASGAVVMGETSESSLTSGGESTVGRRAAGLLTLLLLGLGSRLPWGMRLTRPSAWSPPEASVMHAKALAPWQEKAENRERLRWRRGGRRGGGKGGSDW